MADVGLPNDFKEVKGDAKFLVRKKLAEMQSYDAELYVEDGILHILVNVADMNDSEGRDFLLVIDPSWSGW